MSEIEKILIFPLDENCFLRRECPYCYKEFKVQLSREELIELSQISIDSYLLEPEEKTEPDEGASDDDVFCPYCGQRASKNSWWTQEQLAYIHVAAKNIMANLLNEHLIKPLRRDLNKPNSCVRFEGKLMEQHEPWISPEENDMKIFDLPCCQRQLKVPDDWSKGIFCCFCGFPHQII